MNINEMVDDIDTRLNKLTHKELAILLSEVCTDKQILICHILEQIEDKLYACRTDAGKHLLRRGLLGRIEEIYMDRKE